MSGAASSSVTQNGTTANPSAPLPPAAAADAAADDQTTLPNVTVSLRVALNLGTDVRLFAYPADVAVNPVLVTNETAVLSASSLSGLFTYQETGPSGENIVGGYASTAAVAAAAVGAQFVAAVGDSEMPAANPTNLQPSSGTALFGAAPYLGVAAHQYHGSVGHMALAWAAHQMFGHVAATAAIDNDDSVISEINGKLNASVGGLATALQAISAADLTAIAASVIGQDSARAESQGDNSTTPKALLFRSGDTIIVRIVLTGFTATNANSNQVQEDSAYGIAAASQQYDLVFTVGE